MKILHTADWHLWHKHKYTRLVPGRHWDYMFEAQLEVLKNIFLSFVRDNKIDYFIIAGDVFHHYNPIEPIRAEFVQLAQVIARFCKVYILLGNHDIYKEQKALEAVKLLTDESIQICYKPFVLGNKESNLNIWVDHCGVYGFEANGGYIEKPENVMKQDEFAGKFKLVLLGHYHKNQHQGNIFYSGSPYPIDFGESGEQKYFNLFEITDNKITRKKHEIKGIAFITVDGNDMNTYDWTKYDEYKYLVVRSKKECTPDREKEFRTIMLESKKVAFEIPNILDYIVDLKVVKESIKNNIKDKKLTVTNIIDSLKLSDEFADYIYGVFSKIES